MLEREIEKHLVKRMKEIGGEVRKVGWINRRGAPDRMVLVPGAILWIELKKPGKKADSHQEREIKKLERAGQTVLLIDTKQKVDRLADLLNFFIVSRGTCSR